MTATMPHSRIRERVSAAIAVDASFLVSALIRIAPDRFGMNE
jgi:hypothetical protein